MPLKDLLKRRYKSDSSNSGLDFTPGSTSEARLSTEPSDRSTCTLGSSSRVVEEADMSVYLFDHEDEERPKRTRAGTLAGRRFNSRACNTLELPRNMTKCLFSCVLKDKDDSKLRLQADPIELSNDSDSVVEFDFSK